jgi:hypothetical protein
MLQYLNLGIIPEDTTEHRTEVGIVLELVSMVGPTLPFMETNNYQEGLQMRLVKILAVLFCVSLFCLSDSAEAGLLGRGGGLLSRRGGSSGEDGCEDGKCGLLSRFRNRNDDPEPTPLPPPPIDVEPGPPVEMEASVLPPWAYLLFGAPAILILAGCLGGGSYLLTRKLQEGE